MHQKTSIEKYLNRLNKCSLFNEYRKNKRKKIIVPAQKF